MNKIALLLSAMLAITAGIGTAHSADKSAAEKSAEKLGEHPAVIVARTWNARSIDPNTFIVAHPARGQVLAASPNVNKGAEVQATASAAAGK